MHAALLIPQLRGLSTRLIGVLAKHPNGANQNDLWSALGEHPSLSTVSRALSQLIKQGVVEKTGQTKGALFHLSPEARYWATPSHQRAPVRFNPARIDDYAPNVTQWLPEAFRAAMERASEGMNERMDASTYSKQIAERFMIDLAWSSSALEGNTYSMLDTEILIKYGQAAEGHDASEATMILNHKRAISFVLDQAQGTDIGMDLVAHTHGHLMRGLLSPEALGRVRNHEVRISHSAYYPSSHPTELAIALGSLTRKAQQVNDPFEAMFVLTAGISYIQAFEDGNKRLGRLAGNLPLLRAGLPPMSFVGVDKRQYIQGLIEFYELGSTQLLAQTLATCYVDTVPVYKATTASQRIPRSIELREAKLLDESVRRCVALTVQGAFSGVAMACADLTERLTPEDRDVFEQVVNEVLAGLTLENAPVWGVQADQAKAFVLVTQRPTRSIGPK